MMYPSICFSMNLYFVIIVRWELAVYGPRTGPEFLEILEKSFCLVVGWYGLTTIVRSSFTRNKNRRCIMWLNRISWFTYITNYYINKLIVLVPIIASNLKRAVLPRDRLDILWLQWFRITFAVVFVQIIRYHVLYLNRVEWEVD